MIRRTCVIILVADKLRDMRPAVARALRGVHVRDAHLRALRPFSKITTHLRLIDNIEAFV